MTQQYQPVGGGVQQPQGGGQFKQSQSGAPSQQGQTGIQSQQGQPGVQSGQQQGFQPAHFDEALPSEYRAVLEDLSWLRKQTKWASEQAHRTLQGTGVETTLEDISEIAELNEELILGNSQYVEYEIDTFRVVATEAIQQLQQFQQEPFVEAIVSDLSRALNSAEELLAKQGGAQAQQSQIPGQGQTGGQPQTQTQAQPQAGSQPQTQQPFGQSY